MAVVAVACSGGSSPGGGDVAIADAAVEAVDGSGDAAVPAPPHAEAGHARVVTIDQWSTVDATRSTVPGGCSVAWQPVDGNPGALRLEESDSLSPRVSPVAAGTHRLRLSIDCPGGASSDEVLVHAFERPVASFADERFAHRLEGTTGDNLETSTAGRKYVFDPSAYSEITGAVTEVWIDVRGQRLPMQPEDGRFVRWVPDASLEEPRWYWAFVGTNRFATAPVPSVRVVAAGDRYVVDVETPLAASFGAAATSFTLLADSPTEDAEILRTGYGRFEVRADFSTRRRLYVVAEGEDHRSTPRLITLPPPPRATATPGLGVVYQVFVKHFADSDGDGIGDLRGLIGKLPYLREQLGVDTLLLMPIFDTPGTVGWGYAPRDLTRVHADYGTDADLAALLAEAHARGMRVLLDVPMNHVHRSHQASAQAIGDPGSPTSSWFYFFEDNTRWFGWDFRDDGALSHFFARRASGDIAVNLDDPDARQAIVDAVVRLLDPDGDGDPSDGADGLRLDYVKGPSKDFWRELAHAARTVSPDVALIGEAWSGTAQLGEYLREAGLGGVFDFPFQYAARAALEHGDAGRLYWHFAEARAHYGDGLAVPFAANHDVSRLISDLQGDGRGRAFAAASIVLTAPGSPLLFFGDELGMLAHQEPDLERKNGGAFPWGAGDPAEPADPAGPALRKPSTLAAQKADPDSLFAHHKALLALRRSLTPLGEERAQAWHYQELADPGLYAIVRPSGGERALVVVNLTGAARQVAFSERAGSTLLYRQGGGSGATIGPFGTHVYRLP